MTQALIRAMQGAVPGLRTSTEGADQVAYARDLWPRHLLAVRAGRVAEHRPAAIVWPESTAQVSALVRWAAASRTPIVPFGAGSGVCAGVLPRPDVVVVDMKRLARIRHLATEGPTVVAESGCMGMPFEEHVNRHGFTLGHFPSSILCSTVGGWIAARSAGQCSGRYGKIEDMVVGLECVTGTGEVLQLTHRRHGPNLIPLVVGSEGILALVTAATLRLHPTPNARSFLSWSFPTTEDGWEAMRRVFQAGLRPAVARLYDPFDAMLARRGRDHGPSVQEVPGVPAPRDLADEPPAPGLGHRALLRLLKRPGLLNDVLESGPGAKLLGGALLVMIFEGDEEGANRDAAEARHLVEGFKPQGASRGTPRYEGEAPARRWLSHRYAVSYRMAPTFAMGAFVDTLEVAAPWSRLGALYDAVRRALGKHVLVMAHFSHAYADGCCIYFSFAGGGAGRFPGSLFKTRSWDQACEATYDEAWRSALAAAVEAGGTLAHHHGVGRSKAPRLGAELGVGVDVVRALQRTFDPVGILNPGNLVPPP